MIKPTPCKYKRYLFSGFIPGRSRLKQFSIMNTQGGGVDIFGEYLSFRHTDSSGEIALKWEWAQMVDASITNVANFYVYSCTIPGNGILFPEVMYCDFTELTTASWAVGVIYQ
jgi:hypothetical protein